MAGTYGLRASTGGKHSSGLGFDGRNNGEQSRASNPAPVIDPLILGGNPEEIVPEPFPFPGKSTARRYGCICPNSTTLEGTIENPWILDANCPLQGEAAYQEHKKGPRH